MTGERTDAIAVDPPVERLLATAATDATWPATPDLRSTVLERIEAPGAPDLRPSVLTRIGGRAVGSPRRVRVLRPLALAVLLVIAIAGLAAGLGYGLPGLDLRRVDETPAPPGAPLGLGSPAPLADVLALDEPRILLPGALPPPDAAFERGVGDRRIVTVAWRASPGDPVLEDTDLVLTLMAVPGTTAEPLISKAAGPQTRVEPIDVDGDRGWWITGAPHEIMVLRSDGEVGVLRAAVVGDTLVFAREGTLYRLESALGKAATLEIARSLKRP